MKKHLPVLTLAGALALMSVYSCTKGGDDKAPAGLEQDFSVGIWAHRGCSCREPENTLKAFRAACELDGLTGIELDIQLTKDGEIVVIHDETVDRTTNGHGNVRDLSLAEIKKLRVRARPLLGFRRYTEERIPLMEEVLGLVEPYCKKDGLLINIELKNSVFRYEGMEQKILDLVAKHGLQDHIIYSSFNPDSVLLLKELDPSSRAAILASSAKECLDFSLEHGIDGLHPSVGGLGEGLRNKTPLPVRVWGAAESFYPAPPSFARQDLERLEVLGATDLITNVPEEYLQDTARRP